MSDLNWLRARAIVQSRAFKRLFCMGPPVEGEPAEELHPIERLFTVQGGTLSRDGEAVLADLRDFCFAQQSSFSTDAVVMARREGRREVWLRLMKFLNLDENQVQLLMEVDDGL